MKIAVVGSGIAGLACAYRLAKAGQDVTLFEAADYFGGHSHTVDVTQEGVTHGVDTGFLVFNERTYPNLIALFDELQVESSASAMSFSVKLPLGARSLEWAGANLDTVFAQRRNVFDPRFVRMLGQILRFNREASALALAGTESALSLGDFLDAGGYGAPFRAWYLLPMAACIWSCPPAQMLAFPLSSFVRFCHNHGLLQVRDRPQWRSVVGGARQYVDKMLAAIPQRHLACPVRSVTRQPAGGARAVRIETAAGTLHVDHVVLACHSDTALALLADARAAERAALAAIRYQANRAVLHTDTRCLPARRKAWSAWNYQCAGGHAPRVCVHYLVNLLQPLPFRTPILVSLNPIEEPDPAKVIDEFAYAHPVFDAPAVAAQAHIARLQGVHHTWFAGAWTGYGFHEDGLKSGLAAAAGILQLARGQSHAAA